MTPVYPPLAEVRRELRPDWYRCPIDRDRLRELSQRSDAAGWIQAGGHFSLFVCLGALTFHFWLQEQWWAFAVALWCHGAVASYFSGTAPHELGHGTVFRTAWLNRAFLYLVSLVSWWDPFDYASSHTYHHRFTTYPQADRENVLPIEPSLHPWLVLQLLTVNLFSKPGRNFGKGGLLWTVYLTTRTALGIKAGAIDVPSQEWLGSLHVDQPKGYRQSVRWSRILLLFHGVVVVASLATGYWVVVLMITLPSFIARFFSYLTGLPQHCGLRENVPDFRKNSRSMKLNPLLEFLYWRMNWHAEHHMYANVPCYNLKTLARELADDMPAPRTLIGAWQEMRNIHRRQRIDPAYQFDTPLPDGAGLTPSPSATTDDLASSIGDLAPECLRSP